MYSRRNFPLIAFIHVPKTAGTTVGKVLYLCSPYGHGQLPGIISAPNFPDLVDNDDWICGHVERDTIRHRLVGIARPIEYFSAVRQPIKQLTSCLNYSFERQNRDGDRRLLSRSEHDFDRAVMGTDFGSPRAIISLLLSDAAFLLNLQSQLILGADCGQLSKNEMYNRLAQYTFISTEHNIQDLYRAFGFARLPENVDQIRENRSRSYFDFEIMQHPEVQEFLNSCHQVDQILYRLVLETHWPAAGRAPHRPAFLGVDIFTFDNFDEGQYRASNPDLAPFIGRPNGYVDGYSHFNAAGHGEARPIRQLFLPIGPGVIAK